MNCTKCGGLFMNTISVTLEGTFTNQRCIACGRSPNETQRPIPAAPEKTNPLKETLMTTPRKGWTEERRAKFKATFTAKRGEKPEVPAQPAQPKKPAEESRPSSPPAENPSGVYWAEWRQSMLAQMDQAIGQLEEQLTKTKAARAAVEAL